MEHTSANHSLHLLEGVLLCICRLWKLALSFFVQVGVFLSLVGSNLSRCFSFLLPFALCFDLVQLKHLVIAFLRYCSPHFLRLGLFTNA